LPRRFVDLLQSEGLGQRGASIPATLSASAFPEGKEEVDTSGIKLFFTFKDEGELNEMSVGEGARSPHFQAIYAE